MRCLKGVGQEGEVLLREEGAMGRRRLRAAIEGGTTLRQHATVLVD
jgi:hypothetical protein